MAKARTSYACTACGAVYKRWQGKCDECGEWNTIEEAATVSSGTPKGLKGGGGKPVPLVSLNAKLDEHTRLMTGIEELDRTFGGGLVAGSATLVGGDPGIGKSTLLLQAAARYANKGLKVLYFSGEEATAQVQMRAGRLDVREAPVELGSATDLRDILTTMTSGQRPDVVIIDSIQTVYADSIEAAPGTVSQVRLCAHELIGFAKRSGAAMILVGHVTKDGQIAGPRVLEHMVDTVLYFEGDRGHQFRILRAVKNRFGGTDEIGVFEMTSAGLAEVSNPSALFLADRATDEPGSVVLAGIEGSRPVLVEIQALVARSPAANPRRAVVGWDSGRLAMVIAVLDSRLGLGLAGCDIYLNVAGGLKITEPAADLAVALALLSSLTGKVVPGDAIVFGELALSGDIRKVPQADARLKEGEKLGFTRAYTPSGAPKTALSLTSLSRVQDLGADFLEGGE